MLEREGYRSCSQLAERFVVVARGIAIFIVTFNAAVRKPVVRNLEDVLAVMPGIADTTLVVGHVARLPVNRCNVVLAFGQNDCSRVQLDNRRVGRYACTGRFFKSGITWAIKGIDERKHLLSGIALSEIGMACYGNYE